MQRERSITQAAASRPAMLRFFVQDRRISTTSYVCFTKAACIDRAAFVFDEAEHYRLRRGEMLLAFFKEVELT